MQWGIRKYEKEKENEKMINREILVERKVYLTKEDLELMINMADEMDIGTDDVVSKALHVLKKCREFIGEFSE